MSIEVGGATRLSMIVGTPIAQVKSPELMNRRFEDLGLDRVLLPADIARGQVGAFMAALRGWANVDGCIITIPHKRDMVALLDEVSDRVQRLQAVNVVRREADGRLVGDNFDGTGHVAAAAQHGFNPAGMRALVIGTGGVGSAIADALCEAGIRELVITDIDVHRAAWLRDTLAAQFPQTTVSLLGEQDLSGFDLVTNATPVGMDSAVALPISEALVETLASTTLVAEVVTRPVMTAFLQRAQARGCRIQTGPEMAAAQTELLGKFMGCL